MAILKIRDNNGNVTEIPAIKGEAGKTPVKGVDYFTAADITEIVEMAVAQITNDVPVIGTVDENNVILLSGRLTNGTYTFKYENADGSTTEIGTVKVSDGENEELPYTNQIPISTDTDGSTYGFSENTYLSSSSGTISSTAKQGVYTTGFIPCKVNDIIRFANMNFIQNATNANYHRVCVYDSTKKFINFFNANGIAQIRNLEQDSSGTWKKFQLHASTHANAAFIRVCCEGMSEESVITINEEIV